jgi:membrane protein DedA with SNARE-associated domain
MTPLAFISKYSLGLVVRYKYAFLVPVTVVEGPLITLAAGFLVYKHVLNPFIALPLIIVADVVGDLLYYAVGRYGKNWRITKAFMKRLRFEEHQEKVEASFHRHGGKLLLAGKLTHTFGIVFLVGAGYFKMDIVRFTWYNLLGTILKSSCLLYAGYLAGSAYAQYAHSFASGAMIFSVAVLLLILVSYVIWKRRSRIV